MHGAYEVWLLDGNCRIVQGTIQATSRAGVLWVIWGGIQANSLVEALLFDIGIPPVP